MPAVSRQQEKAMYAAAEGKSRLGIPVSVGKEFTAQDGAPIAAGIVFVAPDGDVLLVRRSDTEENYAGHWALPGGKADAGETAVDCAMRESREEIGFDGEPKGLKVLDRVMTPNGMDFMTYAMPTAKFMPKLNGEHSRFAWVGLDALPKPLHPSVARVLGENLGVTQDMQPADWEALREGFLKWTLEEEAESEHAGAMDEKMALDRAPDNRYYDADGHLHIRKTPISKANVCPYIGREIPDFEALGLDPDKVYQLYRDPKELAKGAETSNNKPLLSDHIPITLEEPNREKWAGSLGTDAVFEAPYLYNSIAIWDKRSIKGVEDESKRELSAGYRYRADMTPGEIGGIRFDGVMRDIIFNHVSLVYEGRAGADVMAADAALKPKEPNIMKTALTSRKALLLAGAALGAVRPKLAQDAKLDLSPAFAGVTAKNLKAKKPEIAKGLKVALDGKLKTGLALDATVEEVVKLIDACEGDEPAGVDEVPETAASSAVPVKTGGAEDEEDDPKRKFLKEKLSAEDMKAFDEMNEEAEDEEPEETEEEKKARMAKEAKDKKAKDAQPKGMDKGAMDAALAEQRKQILAEQRELREAEAAVRKDPRIGALHIAADTAADVYGAALKHIGVDTTGIPASAFRRMFEAMPAAEPRRHREDDMIAMDGAATKSFSDRFPGADRILNA